VTLTHSRLREACDLHVSLAPARPRQVKDGNCALAPGLRVVVRALLVQHLRAAGARERALLPRYGPVLLRTCCLLISPALGLASPANGPTHSPGRGRLGCGGGSAWRRTAGVWCSGPPPLPPRGRHAHGIRRRLPRPSYVSRASPQSAHLPRAAAGTWIVLFCIRAN
jgi:hypothetical protein